VLQASGNRRLDGGKTGAPHRGIDGLTMARGRPPSALPSQEPPSRIQLAMPLREWLEKAVAPPLVRRHGISPAIAAEVAALPDSFHRDPADRILVATARILGATLLTQDRHITESGLVETLG